MPVLQSRQTPVDFTSPETHFHLPFPANGPSILDHDRALGERFMAVGGMSKVFQYIIDHSQRRTTTADLGILNERFEAYGGLDQYQIDVTPIGANDDVLLGYFDLSNIHNHHRQIEQGDVVDLFGAIAKVGRCATGYLVLNRKTVSASGMGVMRYNGLARIFNATPNSENLFNLVKSLVPTEKGFSMARADLSTNNEL